MRNLLVIKGDTNDADYISEETWVKDEDLLLIEKVVALLSAGGRWSNSEYGDQEDTPEEQYVKTGLLTELEVDAFSGYMPHGEYGVHSIDSITLHKVAETTILYR